MDLISGSTYFGSVRANDLAGNRGMVLSGNGVTVDNTPPTLGTVDDILNNTAEDLDFSAVTDTIYARWYNFNDELSGINNYKYAIGTQPGGTQNLYWTLSETGNQIAESGLTLIHGITYYVSVKATDYVGNESGFAASDGITIDIQSPTGGYVNDGSNDDLDYSVNPNTLEGNWGDFSDDLSGIISYEYAVGTLEGYDDIIPWTLCWLDTNFYNDQLVLENGRTYYTSVRAKDLVGNVSVPISSNGVTIDFNLPEISYLYEET